MSSLGKMWKRWELTIFLFSGKWKAKNVLCKSDHFAVKLFYDNSSDYGYNQAAWTMKFAELNRGTRIQRCYTSQILCKAIVTCSCSTHIIWQRSKLFTSKTESTSCILPRLIQSLHLACDNTPRYDLFNLRYGLKKPKGGKIKDEVCAVFALLITLSFEVILTFQPIWLMVNAPPLLLRTPKVLLYFALGLYAHNIPQTTNSQRPDSRCVLFCQGLSWKPE